MINPYFLMTALFAGLAVLGALDTSTSSYGLIQALAGLQWLRVHFVTLGMLVEAIFGMLAALISMRANLPKPKIRWDIWAILNTGLIVLFIGMPMINNVLILTGGIFVFVAAGLVIKQLITLPAPKADMPPRMSGYRFYLAGLTYLLVGIIVGTGIWLGWSASLNIASPIEVHVHANNWGFLSLVFAGLIIDHYPSFAGYPLAWPRSIGFIWWLMVLGALGLVIGPWFKIQPATVAGLLSHTIATVWLIANMVKPLLGRRLAWSVGLWHIVSSYVWLFAPVFFAPFVLLNVSGFPAATVEQNAPQALIYGWVLQFGFATLPYFFRYLLLPDEKPSLGGNWLSLIAVHLGGIFLWASIFVASYQSVLHGTAYALWIIALVPIVLELWQILQKSLNHSNRSDVKAET